MFSQRLKQTRLARGLSLEDVVARMGGIVTKQALSKYERGISIPSPVVLTQLASALGVNTTFLFSEPAVEVRFLAYRKHSALGKREQEQVESLLAHRLEERVRLQELIGESNGSSIPLRLFSVRTVEDTEEAAVELRRKWNLGLDPIMNVTAILEDHFVHVILVSGKDHFDGLSAIASEGDRVRAAAIVTRFDVPGERQRLNLTHELGHLVLDVAEDVRSDEEKVAFRFGAAFLAPREVIVREVGQRRGVIQLGELLLLKRQFGISLQALLYRLRDLEIVSDSHYQKWCRDINFLQWRKHEPDELPPERPHWLVFATMRALDAGLLTLGQAESLLDETLQHDQPLSLIEKRAFMRLPAEKRRELLSEQANHMAEHYSGEYEWKEFQGGEFVDD